MNALRVGKARSAVVERYARVQTTELITMVAVRAMHRPVHGLFCPSVDIAKPSKALMAATGLVVNDASNGW